MGDDPPAAVRAFLAMDLDPTSLRRVARASDHLRMSSGAPSAQWTPPERMHVTLKFMAKLPLVDVDALTASVRTLVEGRQAPEACAFKLGAFPSPSRASVVVAELVDPTGGLRDVAEEVAGLAKMVGLPRETRRFKAHVTLARIKLPFDTRRWLRQGIAEAAGACRGGGVTLFRSDLGAAGSTYVPLARFAFATA